MSKQERFEGGMDVLGAARRRWGVPALAITLLAGTSTGFAQDDSGFGLLDAVRDQAASYASEPGEPGDDIVPAEPVDFADLEGSVSVSDYDLVDLHVNSEDLGAVLQLLSIQSQRNIISSNSVQASVTADLYGVTFYEALDAILHVNGFGYIEKGNFIYVYTREELEEFERLSRTAVSKVITLDYLNATNAGEFVKHLLSETGAITTSGETETFSISDGSPAGADNYANSATIVVHDFEENVEEIIALLSELDTKPVQVLVEATILQTSLNEANAFGLDFAVISDLDFTDFIGTGGPLSVVDGLISGAGETVDGTDVLAAGADGDGFGLGSSIGNVSGPATLKAGIVNEDVSIFLRVLDEVTDVTVVSNPKLLTLNRQPARVLVGTKVGYLNTTTTETATTQTVEFLDVGTQLSMRPFVSQNGLIRLELSPQVSSFTLRQVTDNSGAVVTIPDEDTTEMTTNVMLRDGQTAVLGGLFTETTTSTRRQVPVLGDIPLIGAAFKGYDDETRRSEIVFLITPSIVNDDILTDQGQLGAQYVEHARVGARKSLLPFSRERRVGQLLIEARRLADEGDTNRALFTIERALRLSPQSPDARAMRAELTNELERFPSRAIINGVLHRELLEGETPLVDADEFEAVESPAQPEVFAEVSSPESFDQSEFQDSFETESEPTFESPEPELEIYAEVPTDTVSFEDDQFESDEFAEEGYDFVAESDAPEYDEVVDFQDEFVQDPAPSFETASVDEDGTVYHQVDPGQMLPEEAMAQYEQQFSDADFVPVPDDGASRFSVMKSLASTSSQQTPAASTDSPSGYVPAEVDPVLASDWADWAEGDFPAEPLANATPGFGGFLVIPLPGGGALQVEWPITEWSWPSLDGSSAPSVFTSAPTDSE